MPEPGERPPDPLRDPDEVRDTKTTSSAGPVRRRRGSGLLGLSISFGKVGLFGFGGGPAMIPLIQQEVVDARRWLTREGFVDAFAFGNALPGPIATKLAGYVGHRVAGWPGVFVALFALILPTAVMMVALAALYATYGEHPAVASFLRGVRPVVIALLALVVIEFVPAAFGRPRAWGTNASLWLLALVAFVLVTFYGVHPALLILAGGIAGVTVVRTI